jgi:hypothetical protein
MASGKVLARRSWVDRPELFGVIVEAIFATERGARMSDGQE